MAKIDRTTRFPIIQSLRGFAALWVLLFHAEEGKHLDRLISALPAGLSNITFHAGHFGVPIFFALSGFVITHSLRDLPLSGRIFSRFVLRRAVRLDPPYWISIAFTIIYAYLSARLLNKHYVFPSLANFGAHLVYMQVVLRMPIINPVFWTLTYEFQFYIFLAGILTLAAIIRIRLAENLAWGIMYLLAIVSAGNGFSSIWPGIFVGLWPAFFIGALCYRAVDNRLARISLVPILIVIAIIHSPFMLVSAATALFLLATTMMGIAQRKARFFMIQHLGAISYSLYLIHNPLTGATGFAVHRAIGTSVVADIVALISIILVSVVGATLFCWAIERPTLRLTHAISLDRAHSESADTKFARE